MIERNICSLELSKKLHDLGINKKSLFYWEYYNDKAFRVDFMPYVCVENQFSGHKNYSAFTASELIELLPKYINIQKDFPFNNFFIKIEKFHSFDIKKYEMIGNYLIKYVCDTFNNVEENLICKQLHKEIDSNFSNALAKMVVFLIENKYLKFD